MLAAFSDRLNQTRCKGEQLAKAIMIVSMLTSSYCQDLKLFDFNRNTVEKECITNLG